MREQRALFLDRDGVVNEEVGYLHRAEEVRFVDGIFSLCRAAAGLGYRLIVVTNQAGIAVACGRGRVGRGILLSVSSGARRG
jgi:histidinol phosphatase-like enzyme